MEPTPPGTSDTVSSQKSLPSSHDPGWNDPPEWALSSQRGADGTSTKRFLNKRVAFPLSSQSSAAGTAGGPPPSSNMPPCVSQSSLTITTAPHKPLVTPVDRDPVAIPLESNFDKDQALTKVLNNLGSVITEHRIEKSKAEEIQKKLDIMKSDWLEDKLNNAIQRSILDVSEGSERVFASVYHYRRYKSLVGIAVCVFQHC